MPCFDDQIITLILMIQPGWKFVHHDCSVLVACANVWFYWIINVHVKARFKSWPHEPFVKLAPSHFATPRINTIS